MRHLRTRFMTVRKCKTCGADVTGRRQSCDECQRKRKLANVKRFYAKRRKQNRCICCGVEINHYPQKYCRDCFKISSTIKCRYVIQHRRAMSKPHERYARSIAFASVAASDILFKTDKCDQDCANCKYEDCIL